MSKETLDWWQWWRSYKHHLQALNIWRIQRAAKTLHFVCLILQNLHVYSIHQMKFPCTWVESYLKSKICRLHLHCWWSLMKCIWNPTLNGSKSTTCDSTRGAGLKNSGGTRSMTTWPKCDSCVGVESSNCHRGLEDMIRVIFGYHWYHWYHGICIYI